jgi:thiol:disulfide interchange protein
MIKCRINGVNMNSKKMIALFHLCFLILGPGCYAEDPGSFQAPSVPAKAASPAVGLWLDGWYQGASGFDEALEEYRRTNRPMLVYMTAAWCPYCRKFEKGVLASPEVRDFLKDKIKVAINPDDGPRENELAFQYGIRGFPSLFLHPPQPARALQFPTSVTPEEFVELFRQSVQ